MAAEVASRMEEVASSEKRPRKRLKKLMVDICQQMEFYFSDANLRKDRFLKKEMSKSEDGYVSVDILAGFNRIKSMTQDRKIVLMAIQQSSILELSKDEMLVRRTVALKPPKHDPDDCTVYVECLPKKVDHEWLRKTFSYCGNVVYISLPRYKSTGDIKRFAFIEFESPEEAHRACKVMNNPPPDMDDKPGRFPKMRGNRRILPLEFSSVGDGGENRHSEELDTEKEEHGDYRHRDRDQKRRTVKTIHSKEKPRDGHREKLKRKRSLGVDDEEVEKKNEKKRFDPETETRTNTTGERHASGTCVEEAKRKKSINQKRNCDRDVRESKDMRKGRKRMHSSDDEEDAPKSAKKEVESHRDDGKISEVVECNQNWGKRRDEAAKGLEERKAKLIDAGRRRTVKRKRSLSEGDLWEMKHSEDTKESDSDAEQKTKKMRVGGHSNVLNERSENKDKTPKNGDTSFSSEMEKRRRNRKKKVKRLQEEDEVHFLRVISKHEWLKLREEYLSLQKEGLSRMKQALGCGINTGMYNVQGNVQASDPVQTALPKEDLADKQKMTEPEFTEGTVMRLQCMATTMSRKEIREHLSNISPVAYVDLQEGHSEGFVRFQSADGPKSVLEESVSDELKMKQLSMSLISGEEEAAYWQKMKMDRINKFNSKQKKKKRRGVSKILQKAERATANATSHIRFDD